MPALFHRHEKTHKHTRTRTTTARHSRVAGGGKRACTTPASESTHRGVVHPHQRAQHLDNQPQSAQPNKNPGEGIHRERSHTAPVLHAGEGGVKGRHAHAHAEAMRSLKPNFDTAARAAKHMRRAEPVADPGTTPGRPPFLMDCGTPACVAPSERQLNEFTRELSALLNGSFAYCDFRPEILASDGPQETRLSWTLRVSVPSQSSHGACWHTVLAEVQAMYRHTDSSEQRRVWAEAGASVVD